MRQCISSWPRQWRIERTATVVPEAGLHARPASEFVQTANQSETDLSVGCAGGDSLGDASSMLAVTGLNIGYGESVRIVATRQQE